MRLLRQQASSYGIDPHKIGVICFSAGAYLAANMSNTEERTYPLADATGWQSPRPDFAIIAYTAPAKQQQGQEQSRTQAACDNQSQGTADVNLSRDERSHGRDPPADGLCAGSQ